MISLLFHTGRTRSEQQVDLKTAKGHNHGDGDTDDGKTAPHHFNTRVVAVIIAILLVTTLATIIVLIKFTSRCTFY